MPKQRTTITAMVFGSFLAVLCLAGVVAADDNDDGVSSVSICDAATNTLVAKEDAPNQKLKAAERAFEESFEIDESGDTWKYGFSQDDLKVYEQACATYNQENDGTHRNGVWLQMEEGAVTLACDSAAKKVTGKAVEFFGVGECLANTAECRAMSSLDLTEQLWKSIGLECYAPNGSASGATTTSSGGSASSSTGSATTTSNDDNTTTTTNQDNVTPGNTNETTNTPKLPFLTDDDVVCLKATSSFMESKTDLKNAELAYSKNVIDKETAGTRSLGYTVEAAAAMKAACELNQGYWSIIVDKHFECVVQGMETMGLHVTNFGHCLAKTSECAAMHPDDPLLEALAKNKIACWDDEHASDTSSSASTNGSATTSGSTGGNASDSTAKPETTDTQSAATGNSNSGEQAPWEKLDLSESDTKCMKDTEALAEKYPKLQSAITDFGNSMKIDMSNALEIKMGFPDEAVENLKSVCFENHGMFSIVPVDEFECKMMTVNENIRITNFANCVAKTDECKRMNALVLMETVWQSMGVQCHEIPVTGVNTNDDDGVDNEGNKDVVNNEGNKDVDNSGSNDDELSMDDALAVALGLSESDVDCMNNAVDLLKSSETLKNATKFYQNAIEINDASKLGYPLQAMKEMEKVCADVGGYWSFVESDDVTCSIKGIDRCIHVYNFGDCVASKEECFKMDPMVVVRGFLKEELKFDCSAKCNKFKETSSGSGGNNNPKDTSKTDSNNNFSASQQNPDNSIGNKATTSYTSVIVALVIVGGLGFFAYYNYKASTARQPITQQTLEVPEISDLRLETLT